MVIKLAMSVVEPYTADASAQHTVCCPLPLVVTGLPIITEVPQRGSKSQHMCLLCNRNHDLQCAGEGPCLLTYFVTSYWQLFVLRALTGISIGGCLPLVFNLLGDLFDAQHRANVLSGVLIATGAGTAIGQALAGLVGIVLHMSQYCLIMVHN